MRTNIFASLLLPAFLLSGCGEQNSSEELGQATAARGPGSDTPGAVVQQASCEPLETREPEEPDYEPASPGQTRACGIRSNLAYMVEVVATGLDQPWAVEPLPAGGFLVTEKGGRMRLVSAAGEVGAPIAGVLPVSARGQGGLLDVALSPSFGTDRLVY